MLNSPKPSALPPTSLLLLLLPSSSSSKLVGGRAEGFCEFNIIISNDQTTELCIPSPLKNNTGHFFCYCSILFCFKWFDERDLHNAFRTLTTLSVWAQRTQNSHHAGTFGCAPSASSASRVVPPHRAKATTPPGPMTFPSASSVANSWTKVSH